MKKKSVSGCFFSWCVYCCCCLSPLMRESLSLSLSLLLRIENVYTMLYASPEWMGKLNWKHILLGIWSITQLIMTFFSLSLPVVFIKDFLFSRSFRYFFFSLSRDLAIELWFNEQAKKKVLLQFTVFLFWECSYEFLLKKNKM